MNNNNFKIPNYRLPCLKQGDLCSGPLTDFHGQPFILCCLPHLTEKEAWLLEAHAREVGKSGGTFAIFLHRNFPLNGSWVRPLREFDLQILVDPMKRLRRSLRLLHNLPLQRCESLIFDRQNLLKFRIFHEFNLRGLSTMLTIAKADTSSSTHLSPHLRHTLLSQNKPSELSRPHQGQSNHINPSPQSAPPKISEVCA